MHMTMGMLGRAWAEAFGDIGPSKLRAVAAAVNSEPP